MSVLLKDSAQKILFMISQTRWDTGVCFFDSSKKDFNRALAKQPIQPISLSKLDVSDVQQQPLVGTLSVNPSFIFLTTNTYLDYVDSLSCTYSWADRESTWYYQSLITYRRDNIASFRGKVTFCICVRSDRHLFSFDSLYSHQIYIRTSIIIRNKNLSLFLVARILCELLYHTAIKRWVLILWSYVVQLLI